MHHSKQEANLLGPLPWMSALLIAPPSAEHNRVCPCASGGPLREQLPADAQQQYEGGGLVLSCV